MEISMAHQTELFLTACLIGVGMGILYDCFRISRLMFRTAAVVIFIEDLLFFILCAAVTFTYMLTANEGQVRVFIILGELLGAVFYYFTIGVWVMKVSKKIIAFLRKLFRLLYRWFIAPFVRLFTWIVKKILLPLRFLVKKVKKFFTHTRFCLKRQRLLVYNLFNNTSKKARRNSQRNNRGKNVWRKKQRKVISS